MPKKTETTENQTPISEGAEENEALTTIRELLTTAPDNRAKVYVELQLEDYDNAANDSQRAKVLSNLRAGLKNRAESNSDYTIYNDALPQRTRSADPMKAAHEQSGMDMCLAFVQAGHEAQPNLLEMIPTRAVKGVSNPHTVQSMAEYMFGQWLRNNPYQKEDAL